MNEIEPYQLAPGPQWFYVRETGKAWGIAIQASSAYAAIQEGFRQYALQGRTVAAALEATWLHPEAVSSIQSGVVPLRPPQTRPAKVRARPKGKRRSA